jgi:hypothetical protein
MTVAQRVNIKEEVLDILVVECTVALLESSKRLHFGAIVKQAGEGCEGFLGMYAGWHLVGMV